jgi:hypothetical protein
MKASTFRILANLWPPFFFNSIRVTYISEDFREIDVALRLRWYNRNYVGTHFGGNLFSMTDPWYMLMLMKNLGRNYVVWDKKASIDFIAPGRGVVTVKFLLSDAVLSEVREKTASGEKYLPEFAVNIIDAEGKLVARVYKTVYVKAKPEK